MLPTDENLIKSKPSTSAVPTRPRKSSGPKASGVITGGGTNPGPPRRPTGEKPKWPAEPRDPVRERLDRARALNSEHLDLSGLGLEELPPEALELKDVSHIVLRGNALKTVPEGLRRLPKLYALDLGNNALTQLPPWLFDLPYLLTLHVDGNQLGELPIGPKSPKSPSPLRSLDLSFNLFETLKPLAELRQLKHLSISGNTRLVSLPRGLPWLESLDASELGLDLPFPNLSYLRSLKELALSSNPLVELPEWIGELALLERLYACLTRIKRLPDGMRALQKLSFLELSGTHLQQLPEWIGELRSLQHLHVSKCGLKSLPEGIGGIASLRTLSAANDGFTYRLGPSRHRLCAEVLDHYDLPNDLQELPSSLRDCARIERVELRGNDKLGIPEEILDAVEMPGADDGVPAANASAVLGYYFRLRQGISPLNEAKLVLVGRGGAGKTSIVNRLLYDRFHPRQGKTDGIQITPWPFRVPSGDDVRLHVWDFGGQEIMHATHQFFLTHRSLYLLVVSGRSGGEDADAEYWLKLIQSRGADGCGEESPVIVVLNKMAEHSFQMDRRGLCKKYPFIKGFIETDCETGRGIRELEELVRLETGRLRHLRDPFPASWFAIKNRLAGMKENYLTYERFRQICAQYGEADEVAQTQLATYLHVLGVALNYRDDPRLREVHILNPHWVTEGIYTILNSPLVAEQRGVLQLEHLPGILDRGQFPAHMHQFLVNLMRKFELCFPFPDDDSQYLLPELLGKEQPDLGARDFSDALKFQYDYQLLPEGLLPRFIVRTHALSHGLPRWRTGVILEFEGNHASVVADAMDRKVRIAVAGPGAGRRRLLAVIRSNFEHIHSSIEKLKPVEMVPVPGHESAVVPFDELAAYEREGERELRKYIGGRIARLDVKALLEGVDICATPRHRRAGVSVFISYSHKDEALWSELQTHLMLLQRMGLISAWSDRCIKPGEEWQRSVDERLETADVILLLVSADFITSDYCFHQEVARAMARSESNQARVIPIIVRDVAWKGAPFGKLEALPRNGPAVTASPNRDTAWRQVSEEIEAVIRDLLAGRARQG